MPYDTSVTITFDYSKHEWSILQEILRKPLTDVDIFYERELLEDFLAILELEVKNA